MKVLAQGWGDPTGNSAARLTDIEYIFERIISFATYFALLVVFIMLVSGGFKYITSGGDPKQTEQAKGTITYAILGLVALIGIWLILKFVQVFTDVNVTEFKIGG